MMLVCGACRQQTVDVDVDGITCRSCKQTFHLGCTPIQSTANMERLGVTRDTWKCPTCSSERSEQASLVDEVVTRSVVEDIVRELKASSAKQTATTSKELAELKGSVGLLARRVDELTSAVQRVEEEVSLLQTENSRMQTRNRNIWRNVIRLTDEVGELQQQRVSDGCTSTQLAGKNEISSSKAVLALTLSFLTVAGVLCCVATRVFKSLMKVPTDKQDQHEY